MLYRSHSRKGNRQPVGIDLAPHGTKLVSSADLDDALPTLYLHARYSTWGDSSTMERVLRQGMGIGEANDTG